MRRADQPVGGADGAQIAERRMIARQQQVVAVVDLHVERRIVIGPAASAGLAGSLVDDDRLPGFAQPNGRRQPGETGADDMDCARHQTTA